MRRWFFFYPDEDLCYGLKYSLFLSNIFKYIFSFSFVVWRCFFYTLRKQWSMKLIMHNEQENYHNYDLKQNKTISTPSKVNNKFHTQLNLYIAVFSHHTRWLITRKPNPKLLSWKKTFLRARSKSPMSIGRSYALAHNKVNSNDIKYRFFSI